MKRIFWVFVSLVLISTTLSAQGRRRNDGRAHHHNFYHKIELGSGNVYGFGMLSCVSGIMNYVLDDAVAETSFEYPIYRNQSVRPDDFSRQYLLGVVPDDLLHDFQGGLKLGYQSYSPESFNWGICLVGDYKREPYRWLGSEVETSGLMNRALAGGNLMFRFGEMGQSTLFTLELGVRYSYGLSHVNDALSPTSLAMNNGIVSHYAIQVGGPGYFQDIKLFMDISHFALIDSPELKLSPIYVGFSWTVTPSQANMRR